ncbi:hypothetical protein ACFV42_43960 [Streptomyces solisilvae]|uniref:hypothetical protein n=1 Tax=Streptomyces malaysiensis TaxID=92644 RepID=UPI0036D12443
MKLPATWNKGLDLIAVERAVRCRDVCPDLTDGEKRRVVVVTNVLTPHRPGGPSSTR